ncbi:restriction endonuclease subunit S [Saccharomonospora azurea]
MSENEIPLWSVASVVRKVVEPASLGDKVFHYSIPSVDELGDGKVELSSEIKSSKLQIKGGEVLVSKLNPRKSRVIMARRNELPVVASTEFVALRPLAIERRFLFYLLCAETTRRTLDSRVQSVTRSHQRVDPADIARLRLRPPPVEEQRRIADFLDAETVRVEQLISARSRQSSLVQQRVQSLLDIEFEHLASRYGIVPLRRMIKSIEQGWSPDAEARCPDAEEWGVLKAGAVNGGTFREGESKALPRSTTPRRSLEIKEGDFLVSRASGSLDLIGSAAVVDRVRPKLMLCDKIYRLRVNDRLANVKYLKLALRTTWARNEIRAGVSGGEGMANNLPSGVVKSLPIPCAPVFDQEQIVRKIEVQQEQALLYAKKSAVQLELLAERRQALITAAVTGQLDVTTARSGVR